MYEKDIDIEYRLKLSATYAVLDDIEYNLEKKLNEYTEESRLKALKLVNLTASEAILYYFKKKSVSIDETMSEALEQYEINESLPLSRPFKNLE